METPGVNIRRPSYPVDPIFPARWSSRAMSGQSISEEELLTLFEAARWAPSSYNNQPWRFLYAKRDTPAWSIFFDLLVKSNQVWAKNAAVLVVVVSKTTFDHSGKPARTHSYDTGSAWGYLALQGAMKGLVVHGMQGFSYDRARQGLAIPDEYQVEAMIAIGRPGRREDLPAELQKWEAPSDRKSISQIALDANQARL